MSMTIQEFLKAKTEAKDIVEVKGFYYEAKRFKQFLKACKKLKHDVTQNVQSHALEIDYINDHDKHCSAKFNPVNIHHYESSDVVTYITHDITYKYDSGIGKGTYPKTNKKATGKAWGIEL